MARPGIVQPAKALAKPPQPLSPVAAAVALTLCDHDTPLWLDPALKQAAAVASWLGFHTGAPLANTPADAHFAVVADPASLIAFENFAQGTQEYPDRSTTLILQVASLSSGDQLVLEGPGIDGSTISRRRPCRAISSSSGSRTARVFRAASTWSWPRPKASPACRAPRAFVSGGLSHVCCRQGR